MTSKQYYRPDRYADKQPTPLRNEEIMTSSATRRWMLICSGYAFLLVMLPSAVYATSRFAVVSVVNETQANLTINFRWGTGPWQKKFLAPGARDWFSWTYPDPD